MEKANSDVTVSYDPSYFEWHDGRGEPNVLGKRNLTVRISPRWIYLSARASRKIEEMVKARQDGGYTAQIGVAKKAIAIKPVPPGQNGYRFGPKNSGLLCHCPSFISQSRLAENLELPITLQAFWDEKNQMLVAKFPGADDPPKRKRVTYW